MFFLHQINVVRIFFFISTFNAVCLQWVTCWESYTCSNIVHDALKWPTRLLLLSNMCWHTVASCRSWHFLLLWSRCWLLLGSGRGPLPIYICFGLPFCWLPTDGPLCWIAEGVILCHWQIPYLRLGIYISKFFSCRKICRHCCAGCARWRGQRRLRTPGAAW